MSVICKGKGFDYLVSVWWTWQSFNFLILADCMQRKIGPDALCKSNPADLFICSYFYSVGKMWHNVFMQIRLLTDLNRYLCRLVEQLASENYELHFIDKMETFLKFDFENYWSSKFYSIRLIIANTKNDLNQKS